MEWNRFSLVNLLLLLVAVSNTAAQDGSIRLAKQRSVESASNESLSGVTSYSISDEPITSPDKSSRFLQENNLQSIRSVRPRLKPTEGKLPEEVHAIPVGVESVQSSREFASTSKSWEAPVFCHRPLYFEDVNLERYGHNFGVLQPAVSAAHFYSRVPLIPYMTGVDRPRECDYTLGHYRPGSNAPYLSHRLPFSWRGVALEGAAATGTVLLIP